MCLLKRMHAPPFPFRCHAACSGFRATATGNSSADTLGESRIPETLSDEVLGKMHAPPKASDVPVLDSPATLEQYDGWLLGIPTRYGNFPAQWKVRDPKLSSSGAHQSRPTHHSGPCPEPNLLSCLLRTPANQEAESMLTPSLRRPSGTGPAGSGRRAASSASSLVSSSPPAP